ncbi:MAG: GAF domain-containing sensor histidine kinase [Chloroflexi bacterium]|nr:GAF domain-containing sensor histidine kinase [Chloroflexota bacterium]
MNTENREQDEASRINMRLLKWVAILLPILFLAILDVVRHTLFSKYLHTIPGFVGIHAMIALAIVVFSYSIFGFIGRLQRRIIDQNRQLSALNEIAKAAAAKIRLEELLDTSLDQVLSRLSADAGLICILDLEKEEHSAVCYRGFSPEMVRRLQRAKLVDTPIALAVVRTGQPVVWEHVLEDPRVAEQARREGMRSGITAPLRSEDQVNGLLAIASRTERHFSSTDREFLEGIGGQLGMAIRNATLYQQSQLQNRELGALLAVGKVVTSSFDLDELLRASLDTVMEITSADASEIWLMEGAEELMLQCHRGAHGEAFLGQTRFRVGQGIPGIVAQNLEPILVKDIASDSRFLRQELIKAGFHTFCALPLSYHSKLVGVLAVAAFKANAINGPRELRLLEGIGEWLALAIENAYLYQQVQDQAVLQERERIAREMHDGMGQLLGYINTQAIAVKKLLSNQHLSEAREELTKMEDITRDLYADVREGILGLRIASRRKDGLVPALRDYLDHYMEMAGIQVELKVSSEATGSNLAPSVEIQLMRILQEALTNVRKHSKATVAVVTLDRSDNEFSVSIADNGQGFDLTRLPPIGWPRFGLQTMRERAEAVSGRFSIDTSPGQGTRVHVRIPLTHEINRSQKS